MLARLLLITAMMLTVTIDGALSQCIDYADGVEFVDDLPPINKANTVEVVSDRSAGIVYRTIADNHPEYGGYSATFGYDVSVPGVVTLLGRIPNCFIPDCWRLSGISAWGGVLAGLREDSLYIGDASVPSSISLTPIPMLGGTLTAVDGDLVYVFGSDFVVVDVTNRAAPLEVGRNPILLNGTSMVASNRVAYVASDNTLHLFDVSDETDPQFFTTLALPHPAVYLDLAGDFVYAADESTLTIIDISSPLAPVVRSTSSALSNRGIAATDDYVLTANGEIYVIDVSDPDAPKSDSVIGTASCGCPGPFVTDIGIGPHGDILWFGREFISNQTWEASFHFRTLPTPGDPRETNLPMPDPHTTVDAAIAGDFAYALDEEGTVHVIDLSSPLSPVFRGSVATGTGPERIDAQNGFAYVADRNDGLFIVDATNPDAPFVAGTSVNLEIDHVAAAGNHVYALERGPNSETDFLVIRVSTPSSPQVVGSIPYTSARSLAASGTMAYVGRSVFNGLNFHVIDASNPAFPVEVGVREVDTPWEFLVDGSLLYVSGPGTYAIDVSNPFSPTVLPSTVSANFDRMAIHGTVLYGTGFFFGWNGVVGAIDISDPLNLEKIGEATFAGDLFGGLVANAARVYGFGRNLSILKPQCGGATPVDPTQDSTAPGAVAASTVLSIHPAPVRSLARIALFSGTELHERPIAQILDVRGRYVGEAALRRDGSRYTGQWDARANASGVYFVRVATGSGPVTQRFVKID